SLSCPCPSLSLPPLPPPPPRLPLLLPGLRAGGDLDAHPGLGRRNEHAGVQPHFRGIRDLARRCHRDRRAPLTAQKRRAAPPHASGFGSRDRRDAFVQARLALLARWARRRLPVPLPRSSNGGDRRGAAALFGGNRFRRHTARPHAETSSGAALCRECCLRCF